MNREEAERIRDEAKAAGLQVGDIVQSQPYHDLYPNPFMMSHEEQMALMKRHLAIFRELAHTYGMAGEIELSYAMDHAASMTRMMLANSDSEGGPQG